MIGQTKQAAVKQSLGKALGTVKKHAATGAAFLGGVGLAYVTHKMNEHRLPGAATHAGSGPGYSHRAPYIDPVTGARVVDARHAPPGGRVVDARHGGGRYVDARHAPPGGRVVDAR